MKKYSMIVMLIFLSCSLDYTTVLDKKESKEFVNFSSENKYIGIYNNQKNNSKNLYRTIVYDNYIIFEPVIGNSLSGFEVYKNLKTIDYRKYQHPIIKRINEQFFMGIYKNILFIDSGTGPGIRGLELYDLRNCKTIYEGIWDGDKLEFIDENKIIVPVSNNESEPADERGWMTKYYLHKFSFDLRTFKLNNLNKKYYIISN